MIYDHDGRVHPDNLVHVCMQRNEMGVALVVAGLILVKVASWEVKRSPRIFEVAGREARVLFCCPARRTSCITAMEKWNVAALNQGPGLWLGLQFGEQG
jgi:hypothetical protein